jgi:predicted transcriptional regulator
MTLELALPPDLEERLRQEAERRGQPTESVALRLLDEHLPPPLDERRAAALAMLHEGMAEDDQAGDPEEAEEFFRNLDAARTSNRPLFPPELKGISW